MDDAERLNWLDEYTSRLTDVYWHIENEGEGVREAIDTLARLQQSRGADA